MGSCQTIFGPKMSDGSLTDIRCDRSCALYTNITFGRFDTHYLHIIW